MWIKIFPNDTLFFRTGRPFTMGVETWAETIFPPNPSTIYGALRTFLIFHRGDFRRFKESGYSDIGTPLQKGTMKIIGPFLFNSNIKTVYFTAPLDLVEVKGNGKEKKAFKLDKTNRPTIFYTDKKVELFEQIHIYKDKGQVDQPDAYLDDITLSEYLQGKNREYTYVSNDVSNDSMFYQFELKIGIARNYQTLTTRIGHLYRIPMIRLNRDISILIKVEGVDGMPKSGIFQLGGEGKTVYYESENSGFNPLEGIENLNFTLQNRIFKLYLATPAIFENGWLPQWIDENSLEGVKEGIKVKLISCVIGKYIRIGGWDMAKNEPKPMYKAVPAGSVYCFEVLNDVSFEDLIKVFHCKNISDLYPEEGYGLSLIGEV